MNKNIWVAMLLATTAVLAIVAVKQERQLAQMREPSPAVVVAEQPEARPVPAPIAPPPAPPLEADITQPAAAPSPVPGVAPAADSQASTSTGTASNFFSGLAGMMKNPQMKEMIRSQQKFMIDQRYGSLSKYMNLSADQLDALKTLLADHQMALTDSGLAIMGGSESDRKQAMEDGKAIKADFDQKIKDLLGPQDYQTFQDYEKTASDRVQLQMFKGSLPTDAALTDQQEFDLLNAMYEAKKDMPSSASLNNKNTDPSQLTQDDLDEAMKQVERLQQALQQAYADRAKSILTPTQYEQFIKWQQQMSSMSAAAMKMMAPQMFGSKPAPTPATSQSQKP